MARILNQKKADAQAWALEQAHSAEQEAARLLGEVRDLMKQLDCAVSGAPSGMDRALIGLCQSAEQNLAAAQQQLRSAGAAVGSLDVWEEIPDEELKGGYR